MFPLRAIIFVGLLTTCVAARADNFTFNFAGQGQSASGAFVANVTDPVNRPGEFLLTSISGVTNGVPISVLEAPGGFAGNDNLLETTSTGFMPDSAGFSYDLTDGTAVNIFTVPPGSFLTPGPYLTTSTNPSARNLMTAFQITDVTPMITPEPSSFVLLGTGSLGLLGAARRRYLTT